MKTRNIFIFIFISVLFVHPLVYSGTKPAKDIYLLVDNSGSMKKNDPGFLVKKAITRLVGSLDSSSRLGIYLFDEKLLQTIPLTMLDKSVNREKCIKSLDYITYKGALTDLPAAMEKALYELKHNTDSDSYRSIIFITDGFIDTGDKIKDAENRKWLIDSFAEDAKKSGIKIFGVAFTENADYQLIQSLTTKTSGEYYRALKSADIGPVFNQIIQAINAPKQVLSDEEIPSVVIVNPSDEGGINIKMIGIILGGILILFVIFFLILRKSQKNKGVPGIADGGKIKNFIPSAKLIDLDKITGKDEIGITEEVTTIGRAEGNTICLENAEKNISGLSHAQIIFKDNLFYLKDLSTNYTKLNDKKLEKKELFPLKNGDIIGIMKYRFQFILPEIYGQTEIVDEQGSEISKTGTTIEPGGNEENPPLSRAGSNPEIIPEEDKPEDKKQDPGAASDLKSVKNQSSFLDENPSNEQPSDEEEATLVKPEGCPNHPDREPTDVCMECYKPFCKECLTEVNQKLVCKACAAKLS